MNVLNRIETNCESRMRRFRSRSADRIGHRFLGASLYSIVLAMTVPIVSSRIAQPAAAAGVFNGSSSYLTSASSPVGSTPTYPVLMGGWFKFNNTTNDNSLIWMSDNAAAAALDYMSVYALGTMMNGPVWAAVGAGGTANATGARYDSYTSGSWQFVWTLITANNSRYCGIGTSAGTPTGTTRAVTGLNTTTIGVQYWDGATRAAFLNGRGAEVFIASGDASITTNFSTILSQLAAGVRPIHCAQLSPHLVMYQPLVGDANEATAIGDSMTEHDMAYDPGDHPVLINPRGAHYHYENQSQLRNDRDQFFAAIQQSQQKNWGISQ
jgi:hypothetical protein